MNEVFSFQRTSQNCWPCHSFGNSMAERSQRFVDEKLGGVVDGVELINVSYHPGQVTQGC